MIGKLPTQDLIDNVLSIIKKRRKEVLESARAGEDCALLKARGNILVSSDPITGALNNIGKLAIIVASNDIAASGGEPIAAFLTVIAPQGESLLTIKNIMLDAEQTAEKYDIEIAGGHTEYSDAVLRPIVCATIIGEPITKAFSSTNMSVGDSILLTRSIAREYSAIMISDSPKVLQELSVKEIDEINCYMDDLSVIPESKLLCSLPVSSMHDVTEGGVLGALDEMLCVANLGAELILKNIPISSGTKKICKYFSVNPLNVLSSGNMLIISNNPKEIIRILKKNNIEVNKIGEIVSANGITIK